MLNHMVLMKFLLVQSHAERGEAGPAYAHTVSERASFDRLMVKRNAKPIPRIASSRSVH